MGITRFLWNTKKPTIPTPSLYESIYPDSVRYALRYKEAQLGPSEIASLVDRFTYEALYLVIKTLEHPEEKRKYIEDLTLIFAKPDYEINHLKTYLRTRIAKLPENASAGAAKLAQLNRSGSGKWQEAFHALAEGCFAEDKTALPCLIAHTTMLGYHHFVQLYSRLPKAHISILLPEWMNDPENELMGFDVELGMNVHVMIQPKDECLVASWQCMKTECRLAHHFCGNTFFIDDTISTGSTANKVKSFWHSEYGLRVPNERIRVITDLRR